MSVTPYGTRDTSDALQPDIYGHESHIWKAEGYGSQSFERAEATLFNCTSPDRVSAKKKMIGTVFSSKEVLKLHAESIAVHTQRLLATVCDGRSRDMSVTGQFKLDIPGRLAY